MELPVIIEISENCETGMVEKSMVPSIGELIFKPFQSNWVWFASPPLNVGVDNKPGPKVLKFILDLELRNATKSSSFICSCAIESKWMLKDD